MTDWDALIAKHGPHPELLAEAAKVSHAAAVKALNRRGYYLGRGREKTAQTVAISIPLQQIERAGGLERFRDAVRKWAAKKFGGS